MGCEDKYESNSKTKPKKGNPAWQKGGVSPNPGGRPAVIRDLREAAQGYSAEALKTLASVMRDQASPPAAKVAAARELLDRGFGKAVQAVDVNSEVDMGATAAQVLMDLANRAREAKAAEVATAVRLQLTHQKFWEFHRNLLSTRGHVGREQALASAKAAGADMTALQKAISAPETEAALAEVSALAQALKFQGTPAWVIGENTIEGAQSLTKFETSVNNMRKCGRIDC